MKVRVLIAAIACLISTNSLAQMVKGQVTASNGVIVETNTDDFAERVEYSAPSIRFRSQQGGNGFALVVKVRNGTSTTNTHVQGFIVYSGKWKFFRSAVFRGGDLVNYSRTNGDVGSCRYGCTLTENFRIEFTPAQIQKHGASGTIAIQIRADDGDTAIIEIPTSYVVAVTESGR